MRSDDLALPADLTSVESELAALLGVDTGYRDWRGRQVTSPAPTVRAVLTALGVGVSTQRAARASLDTEVARRADRLLPDCVVLTRGVESPVALGRSLGAAAEAWIEREPASGDGDAPARIPLEVNGSGPQPTLVVPANVPAGYHRLFVVGDAQRADTSLIVVPARVDLDRLLGDRQRWGLAAQLYSVPSTRSWGLGDLADLRDLAAWSARSAGADYLLVNPLAVAQPLPPMEASPYLPSARMFANPVYLRVEEVPGYGSLPASVRARHAARADSLRGSLRETDRLDRDAVWAAKRAALEDVFALQPSPEDRVSLTEFANGGGEELADFATWCALAEVHGCDWHTWPERLRHPRSPDVASFRSTWAERVSFHVWLQWQLDRQLAAAQSGARAAGMRVGIVHDLAVGVHAHGADSWVLQDALAAGITVGAPPDALNQKGQNWSQPPWRRDALEQMAYLPYRHLVARVLRHAGGLRIDHVIGLLRLWWIPQGQPPDQGTYVHYDHRAMLGILLLEAERAGAVLVGEDLGNVPPEAQTALQEREILGTSVLWFERDDSGPRPVEGWRRDSLASVTTHDLPPTSGYLHGDHVRLRAELGLLTRPVDDELAEAGVERAGWLAELRRRGLVSGEDPSDDQLVVGLHELVASSPARLVCVALTDAVGERLAQNQPGTSTQYPNWLVPLHTADGKQVALDDVMTSPQAAELFRAVRDRLNGAD